jgi:hypothetical protein
MGWERLSAKRRVFPRRGAGGGGGSATFAAEGRLSGRRIAAFIGIVST